MADEDEEVLVNTKLILRIDIGECPPDRNRPEDFEEYLAQSDHTIQECDIIKVEQEVEHTGEFECGFCLAVVQAEDYPERCERCEMARCQTCGSWLKERDGKQSKFCYGCGTIKPETAAVFLRTSNFSCCYMEEEWARRNRGRHSDGQYSISTGWKSVEDKEKLGKDGISSWVTKRNEDGQNEDVRELTEEEKEYWKGD